MFEQVIEKLKESDYSYFGIRHLTDDEEYNVGDICRNSYDWDYESDCSSYDTDEPVELDGTCAYRVDIDLAWDDDSEIEAKIQDALDSSDCYSGRAVIIAGNRAEDGADDCEIIISNAEVLAIM